MNHLIDGLIVFALLASGLMAGVYFAFSAFVMRSLDAIALPTGMMAMQAINRVILGSSFLPLFFASTLACAVLAVTIALNPAARGAACALAASVIYLFGMFAVTIVANVPLNRALAKTPATGHEAAAMWTHYVRRWTWWNHIRTLSCTLALLLFALALVERW